jgi:Tol biopolymer transport system component
LNFDIWRMNLNLGPVTEQRITSGRGSEISPVWINERSILFAGDSPGSLPHLSRKDLVTDKEESLLPPGAHQLAMEVSSNGLTATYVERGSGGFRLYQLRLDGSAPPTLLLPSSRNGGQMRLSPDDRAMSFNTLEEGRTDVYVSTVPVTSQPTSVAKGVSGPARWDREENRIYYLALDGITMMTVAIRTVPSLKVVGAPKPLFKLRRTALLQDVFRDGRFLLLVPLVRADEIPITVWTAAITSTQR